MFYSGGLLTLLSKDWIYIYKLWITDLSGVYELLIDSYSYKGPSGYNPVNMLRAYLLFLFTNPTIGITKWVDELRRVSFYAIICGFKPNKTPSIGTFYDFFNRLWLGQKDNTHGHVKPKKRKKSKKKKPKKGKKAPVKKKGRVQRLIDRALNYGTYKTDKDTDRLFELFQSQFLEVSASLGLLGDLNNLSISGDGTPVETCSYIRKKKISDDENEKYFFYQQPYIDTGWDSSRAKYYNGYDLYMLTACNSNSDLPIYPKLNKASMHDSIGFLLNLKEFLYRFDISPMKKILLDSAHDAKAIYKLLNEHDIKTFIDLNKRSKIIIEDKSDITISDKGIPFCRRGIKMRPNGFDHTNNRIKWRCGKSKGTKIDCPNPCSKAKYGRNFQTNPKDDLRIYTKTPRDSKK